MSFSFSASGTKAECLAAVESAVAPDNEFSGRQMGRMKVIAHQELMRYPDNATGISVSVHGHVPDGAGGSRSLSLTITGDVPPMPAVTGTLKLPQGQDTKTS